MNSHSTKSRQNSVPIGPLMPTLYSQSSRAPCSAIADAVVVEPVLHPAEFVRDFRVVMIVIPALALTGRIIVAGGLGTAVAGEFDSWVLFVAGDGDCV